MPALSINGDPDTVADIARQGKPALAKPFDMAELQDALGDLLAAPDPVWQAPHLPTGNAA